MVISVIPLFNSGFLLDSVMFLAGSVWLVDSDVLLRFFLLKRLCKQTATHPKTTHRVHTPRTEPIMIQYIVRGLSSSTAVLTFSDLPDNTVTPVDPLRPSFWSWSLRLFNKSSVERLVVRKSADSSLVKRAASFARICQEDWS
jgi:hypothetical protein